MRNLSILFYVIIALTISCTINNKNIDELGSSNSDLIADSLMEKPVIKRPLEDTLWRYIRKYTSIPNPWNAPVIYFVKFEKNNLKSTVTIYSHIGLINFIDKPDPIENDNLVGYFFVRSSPVVIYNIGDNNDIRHYVDTRNLIRDSISKINFFKDESLPKMEWDYVPVEWSYQIENGILIKIK